eukprot:gene12005-18542_t
MSSSEPAYEPAVSEPSYSLPVPIPVDSIEADDVPRGDESDDLMLLAAFSHHANYTPFVTDPIRQLVSSKGGNAKELLKVSDDKHSKKTKKFYANQNEAIDSFIEMDELRRKVATGSFIAEEEDNASAAFAVRISLACNIVILVAKVIIVLQTGSVAFIASLLDSALDIVSGLILVCTNRMANHVNPQKYPLGKRTFEPIGTMVFSACMFTASFQLIQYSVEVLISGDHDIDLDILSVIFICVIIAAKTLLFLYCRKYRHTSPAVDALASDHRNDVLSNGIGVAAAFAAVYLDRWYIDPIAAIVITLYIMKTWALTGYENMMMLSGKSAPLAILRQLTWTARHHHPAILFIDTVRAVALGGSGYQVEVDIVLPPHMSLRETHDIGESLQIVLESAPYVSRAYVHIDYEVSHNPWDHR